MSVKKILNSLKSLKIKACFDFFFFCVKYFLKNNFFHRDCGNVVGKLVETTCFVYPLTSFFMSAISTASIASDVTLPAMSEQEAIMVV